ncbi:MAG: hypothetical protein R2810_13350 [Flavobacteriales bacterium]
MRGGQFWDLNARNTEDELEMTYSTWDVPWSGVNGMAFDSTTEIHLLQQPAHGRSIPSAYAKGVGLVVTRCAATRRPSSTRYCPRKWSIEGTHLTMTATAWGDL